MDLEKLQNVVNAIFDTATPFLPWYARLAWVPIQKTLVRFILPALAERFRAGELTMIMDSPASVVSLIDSLEELVFSMLGADVAKIAKPLFDLVKGPLLNLIWDNLIAKLLVVPAPTPAPAPAPAPAPEPAPAPAPAPAPEPAPVDPNVTVIRAIGDEAHWDMEANLATQLRAAVGDI